MKNVVRILALITSLFVALTAVSVAHEDFGFFPDDTFGSPPPKFAHNWVRLSVLGVRNFPYLVLWISPQAFHRESIERIAVLSPGEYSGFLTFAHSYACSKSIPKYQEQGTLLFSEYASGRGENRCMMPPKQACEFLFNIRKLPNIHWTARKKEALLDFTISIGCYHDRYIEDSN